MPRVLRVDGAVKLATKGNSSEDIKWWGDSEWQIALHAIEEAGFVVYLVLL
jgi:hypothetical protein